MSAELILAMAQQFLATVLKQGWYVSPTNRVSFATAAKLVGLATGTLRNKCAAGEGPAIYAIGGPGFRVSVSLLDLAEWEVSRRLDADARVSRNCTKQHRQRAPIGGR